MRKTGLRAALLLVVVSAAGGIGYLVSRSVVARRIDPLRELGEDFLPQVAQRIQNFRRVKVEKGRTVWQITAKDAQFYEQTGEIVVRDPEMIFYTTDGREVHISGVEGRLVLDGRDLQTLTLRGNVAVRMNDLEMRTEVATYDHAKDLITSPADVMVRDRTLEVHGTGMEVEVGPQHMRLLSAVHTVVRGNATSS